MNMLRMYKFTTHMVMNDFKICGFEIKDFDIITGVSSDFCPAFLKLIPVRVAGMGVCGMCRPPRLLITSGVM